MLRLHDKLTLTLKSSMLSSMLAQSFQCWLQSYITTHEKERCPMLGLHDKPTLTPKFTMLVSVLYHHISRKVFTAKFVYEIIIHQNNMK